MTNWESSSGHGTSAGHVRSSATDRGTAALAAPSEGTGRGEAPGGRGAALGLAAVAEPPETAEKRGTARLDRSALAMIRRGRRGSGRSGDEGSSSGADAMRGLLAADGRGAGLVAAAGRTLRASTRQLSESFSARETVGMAGLVLLGVVIGNLAVERPGGVPPRTLLRTLADGWSGRARASAGGEVVGSATRPVGATRAPAGAPAGVVAGAPAGAVAGAPDAMGSIGAPVDAGGSPTSAGSGAADTRAESPASGLRVDWADTVSVPSWVIAPRGVGRPWLALGTGGTGEQPSMAAGSALVLHDAGVSGAPGEAAGSDAGDGGSGGSRMPLWVRAWRAAGSVPALGAAAGNGGMVLRRLGDGEGNAGLEVGSRWAPLGRCQDAVVVNGVSGEGLVFAPAGAGAVRTGGAALLVPAAVCGALRGAVPTGAEAVALDGESAERLVRAVVAHPGVTEAVGAEVSFTARSLRDLVVDADAAGTRRAYGVVRGSSSSTQLYPAPPQPVVAFVAELTPAGAWTIRWARVHDGRREPVRLAGVYDLGRSGTPDAFLTVGGGSAGHVVVVGRDGAGQWGVREQWRY